ncbi:uncharacterized protein LOC134257137 [Saccostrea cucullata]|uniref:uncharacterized protein LOC134257137 n=1 Tax=Saccostrea cuccullata TaxID=36930 RepID=UPI002ED66BF6
MIVLLNIVDCALVLGELVLDLHHVKNIITDTETMSLTFQQNLSLRYPDKFSVEDTRQGLQIAYNTVLQAKLTWPLKQNNTAFRPKTVNSSFPIVPAVQRPNTSESNLDMRLVLEPGDHPSRKRARRSAGNDDVTTGNQLEPSSIEEKLASAFHGLSLFIVVVLLTETALKVVCFGKHFFNQKLEVFDACIVLASFTVDFVFVNGMAADDIQDFVFILAFMLPWGVIRVVNSLVVAVRDHEHFRLKLLYTQKKKVEQENKQLRQDKDKYTEQIDSMRRLCLAEGIDDWKIQQTIARQPVKPGKGIMGSFASLALGALGGHKSNGSSFWNLLATPKLRRGKSEEWEGKTGVQVKEDTRSLRYTDRVWTVAGTSDLHKKNKKARSLSHQSTVDSDPGTPTIIKGRLKAIKRFLRRQDPVDNASFSSMDTVEKDSKCSLNNITPSENSSPPISFEFDSMDDIDHHVSCSPTCEIINEVSREVSYTDSHSYCDRRESTKSCSEPNEMENAYFRRNSSKKSFRESHRTSSKRRREGLSMRRCESNPEEDSGTTVERIIYDIPDESKEETLESNEKVHFYNSSEEQTESKSTETITASSETESENTQQQNVVLGNVTHDCPLNQTNQTDENIKPNQNIPSDKDRDVVSECDTNDDSKEKCRSQNTQKSSFVINFKKDQQMNKTRRYEPKFDKRLLPNVPRTLNIKPYATLRNPKSTLSKSKSEDRNVMCNGDISTIKQSQKENNNEKHFSDTSIHKVVKSKLERSQSIEDENELNGDFNFLLTCRVCGKYKDQTLKISAVCTCTSDILLHSDNTKCEEHRSMSGRLSEGLKRNESSCDDNDVCEDDDVMHPLLKK